MSKPKIHIAGIGGEGMSAIAKVLIERGWKVSGCDFQETKHTTALQELGIRNLQIGHDPNHITKDLDYLLYTSAIPYVGGAGLDEVNRAKEFGIPTYDRNGFFPTFLKDKKTIAIAGTHGKTSTSSLVSHLLDALGDETGFIVGGTVNNFDTNAREGESDTFVIEADEFGNAFLGLSQYIGVITSYEIDHHDFFENEEAYMKSFQQFADQTKPDGKLIGYGDDEDIRNILEKSGRKYVTYGESPESDCVVGEYEVDGFDTKWTLLFNGKKYQCEIPFPGKQYMLNATAALLVCESLGYKMEEIIPLLKKYKGAGRRFEKFEVNGVTVVSDYGHHPTELKITTEGALSTGRRVIVVYEPHQYKRCAELKDDFVSVFRGASFLIQTPVFVSREKPPYPITDEELFSITKKGTAESVLVNSWEEIPKNVLNKVQKDDIILVMAVGHGEQIVKQLKEVIGNE